MGAALEYVETGRNGWLIGAGEQAALLNAMRDAAALSQRELDLMGQGACESVKEHTLQNGADRFIRYAQQTYAAFPHAATQRRNGRQKAS
jgi:hypothetical protein